MYSLKSSPNISISTFCSKPTILLYTKNTITRRATEIRDKVKAMKATYIKRIPRYMGFRTRPKIPLVIMVSDGLLSSNSALCDSIMKPMARERKTANKAILIIDGTKSLKNTDI